jgi:hypothetical protein
VCIHLKAYVHRRRIHVYREVQNVCVCVCVCVCIIYIDIDRET